MVPGSLCVVRVGPPTCSLDGRAGIRRAGVLLEAWWTDIEQHLTDTQHQHKTPEKRFNSKS